MFPSPAATKPVAQLDDASRSKLDGIVQQMQTNKESDANIQAVVDDFKQKYNQPAAPAAKPTPAGPGIFQHVLDAGTAVTNFLGGSGVADAYGTEIARIGKSDQEKNLISAAGPSVRQTAGSAAQVGAYLLPYGKVAQGAAALAKTAGAVKYAKPIGQALTSVGTGYGLDVASKSAQGKTGAEAFKPGAGTAIGVALPGAAAASGALRNVAANAAPRVINSLVKPLLKDFAYGKDPGRTIASLGITGNSFEDLAANITKARQQIGQQASQLGRQLDSKTSVSVRNALSPIDDAMTSAARNNDTTVLNRLQDVKRAITKVLVPVSDPVTGHISIAASSDRQLDQLPYSQALAIKQQIGNLTKFTGNHSDDTAVNSALKRAYGGIKEALNVSATKADPQAGATLRDLNEKYADLTSAEVATKYRDKIEARKNLISLPASAAGIGAAVVSAISTGGAAIPAILAGVSGVALEKALSTPAVKTRVAAALAKMAPAEADGLFNKLPFLKNFTAPGDQFLKTSTGQKASNYLANVQPGLSTRDITKLHPDDHDLLVRGYEAFKNKTELSKDDELYLSRLLDHIGIDTNQSLQKIIPQMKSVLDGARRFRGTDLRNLTGRKN